MTLVSHPAKGNDNIEMYYDIILYIINKDFGKLMDQGSFDKVGEGKLTSTFLEICLTYWRWEITVGTKTG